MEEFKLNFQPLTLVIPKEREDVYAKVKSAFEGANRMLSDPNADVALKLEIMRVLAILARTLLGAAKDIRTEELIVELEGLASK